MADKTPIVEEGRDFVGEFRKYIWRNEQGVLHRIGDPAYIEYRKNEDGEWVIVEEKYYMDGELSRDDGFCDNVWYKNGRIALQASASPLDSRGAWNYALAVWYNNDTGLMSSKIICIELGKRHGVYGAFKCLERYKYLPGGVVTIEQNWLSDRGMHLTREEWFAALLPVGEAK